MPLSVVLLVVVLFVFAASTSFYFSLFFFLLIFFFFFAASWVMTASAFEDDGEAKQKSINRGCDNKAKLNWNTNKDFN